MATGIVDSRFDRRSSISFGGVLLSKLKSPVSCVIPSIPDANSDRIQRNSGSKLPQAKLLTECEGGLNDRAVIRLDLSNPQTSPDL